MTRENAIGARHASRLQQLVRPWVREHGLTLRAHKVQRREQLDAGEQLFLSIIRKDKEDVRNRLQSANSATFASFKKCLESSGNEALIFENLCSLGLVGLLTEDLRNALSLVARKKVVQQILLDQQLAALLRMLKPFQKQMVWMKGVAASRTLYAAPQHRTYCDLDVVVDPAACEQVVDIFSKAGFKIVKDPGFANQMGVGPTKAPADFLLTPHPDWAMACSIALNRGDGTLVDLKFSPLDRGIHTIEFQRFFERAQTVRCGGEEFFVPDEVDQLIIAVYSLFKDRFRNLKCLVDIDLLCVKLTKQSLWAEFVNRCKIEAVELCAWFGLMIASDRLNTDIPDYVFDALCPRGFSQLQQMSLYTSTCFVWNVNSLPVMLANALSSTDRKRKVGLLCKSVFPSREFLSSYYNRGKEMRALSLVKAHFLHWLVLILPGGLVRRTFGASLWTAD